MLGIGKKHPGDGKEARQHKQRKKVGVAFGGGGLKGSAHVGILKVLTEHNIPIDIVAGTLSVQLWLPFMLLDMTGQ